MKNKGFTIVELLATIVLIGIISLVALGSYSGIKKTIMQAQTNNVVSNIESTAIIYSTSRDRTGWVPLTELVENDFIDKTDLLRIDEYKDENGVECPLLVDEETVNPDVGVFIGQKYAKTNVETEDYDGVSANANLVKSAKFYCVAKNETVDQVKYAEVNGSATSSRFRNYKLALEPEAGYEIIHLTCTNGYYMSAEDIGVASYAYVPDLTPTDSCTLLLYREDATKGDYKKHTYVILNGGE